jgi:hypothetical protein
MRTLNVTLPSTKLQQSRKAAHRKGINLHCRPKPHIFVDFTERRFSEKEFSFCFFSLRNEFLKSKRISFFAIDENDEVSFPCRGGFLIKQENYLKGLSILLKVAKLNASHFTEFFNKKQICEIGFEILLGGLVNDEEEIISKGLMRRR